MPQRLFLSLDEGLVAVVLDMEGVELSRSNTLSAGRLGSEMFPRPERSTGTRRHPLNEGGLRLCMLVGRGDSGLSRRP